MVTGTVKSCSRVFAVIIELNKPTTTVVRPSFPMMTMTPSMMMMVSCLVDPVGAEVYNQSNFYSGPQHSSTLGAWVCRAG